MRAGGTSRDDGKGIAVDSSGNSHVTGVFTDTATFGTTTHTSTSKGIPDLFVAKLDTTGTFIWAQAAGGTAGVNDSGIALDSSGNSHVTGTFSGTATFGATSVTSQGSSDVLVAKLDAAGMFKWARAAGGTALDVGTGIAVDSSGNSYVTGYFGGSSGKAATFGTTTLSSTGWLDVFVARLDATGTKFTWAMAAGGTSWDKGNGIAVDGAGNSYVTGLFQGTAKLGTTSLTSKGSQDVFVARVDKSGTFTP
jgi:hypothetical protein